MPFHLTSDQELIRKTVREGDTLWDLARKHRVSLRSLIAVNRLKSEVIVPGKELLLPEPAP